MGLLDLPGCVVFECVGMPGVLDTIVKGCERSTRIFSAGGPPEGDHLHTMVAKRKGLNMHANRPERTRRSARRPRESERGRQPCHPAGVNARHGRQVTQ